jgi:general secretion pathway protein K
MKKHQRGAAVILAILIVTLAASTAAFAMWQQSLWTRQMENLTDRAKADALAVTALDWARGILIAKDSKTGETGADKIARNGVATVTTPAEGASVSGELHDMQGRFNLNNLIHTDGTPDPTAVKQLERILAMLEIEPNWATAMADWIDQDTQPGIPDGAEDTVYTGMDPPHLAANMPVTRVSELLVLPGFGPERYARLKPFVSALPVGTPLNVCTAPGVVLDALSEDAREFSLNPDNLLERRKNACFPTLEELRGSLGDAAYNELKNSLTESSAYFRATVWVTIGTTQFTLYSLLARGGAGSVRPALRSFGSE